MRIRITLFIVFFIVAIPGLVIIFQYLQLKNNFLLRNGLLNTKVYWSQEWKTTIKDNSAIEKTASFGGSNFSADVAGVSSFTLQVLTKNIDPDTEIVVEVNGKENILQNPNISEKKLVIHFTPEEQKRTNHIKARIFCIGMLSHCSITISKFQLDDGRFVGKVPESRRQIAILGDSISLIYVSQNYSSLLSKAIGYELHNASVWGGALDAENGKIPAKDRYKKDIISYKPDIVIVSLGINDIKNTHSNFANFINSYAQMVAEMKKQLPRTKILVISILQEKDGTTDGKMIEEYNQAISSLAGKNDIMFVDTRGWLESQDYLDQYHPSKEGEVKIFHMLNDYIRTNTTL